MTANDWIPCDVLLPDIGLEVLGVNDDRYVLCERDDWGKQGDDGNVQEVHFHETQECMTVCPTHWMPLPKPP